MSDPKTIVAQAYDSLADWYLTWIDHQPSPRERYAKKLLENLHQAPSPTTKPKPYILELGCGPGVPITRLLLNHGARVLANDISPKQISLAKTQCLHPSTSTSNSNNNNNNIEFIASDMTLLTLPPSTLDGVVCFFTLFHLHLKPNLLHHRPIQINGERTPENPTPHHLPVNLLFVHRREIYH